MKSIKEKREEWAGLHRVGVPPKLWLDDEQRALVEELLTRMGFREIERICRERFGPDRAASHSSIERYWHRTRYGSWPFPRKNTSNKT
ncbi:MAG: hypothetical protein OEZ04_05890 [Nitrospinota bacterium]|nr:hypothetical protein [Nitrospinota bacterium]